MLIRLHGCAGWSASLLFAYGKNRFSHDVAHIICKEMKNNLNLSFYKYFKILNRELAVTLNMVVKMLTCNWATTWQNQQNDCASSEDSNQPGHPPSLIRVLAIRSVGSRGPKLSSCGQQRLWSDWADAQAHLSLRWTHSHFVVLSWGGSI